MIDQKKLIAIIKNRSLIIPTAIGIIFLIMLYISFQYQWDRGYLPLSELRSSDIPRRFAQDCLITLSFPAFLLLIYRKKLSMLGFQRKSTLLCIVLFLIYLLFFILHSDYTFSGVYRAAFYLFMIGFSEEIIMRGYFYLKIKPVNKILAIIISGTLFGAAHAILPGIIADKSIPFLLGDMLNYIGGGIAGSLIFIACLELSGTILVAILIHAIMDYSYGYLGSLVLCMTMGYLIYKNRNRLRNNRQLRNRDCMNSKNDINKVTN